MLGGLAIQQGLGKLSAGLAQGLPQIPASPQGGAVAATQSPALPFRTAADFGGLSFPAMPSFGDLRKKAYGGVVSRNAGIPVEVEGEEALETPMGGLYGVEGPSHEQGGVEAVLPEATRVYSNRVKVDGVTMADRKGKRRKREVTLEKLLEKASTDMLLRNSLERTREANRKTEQMDLAVQELVNQLTMDNGQLTMPSQAPMPSPMGEIPLPPEGGTMAESPPLGNGMDWLGPLDTGDNAGGLGFYPQRLGGQDLNGKEYALGTGPGGVYSNMPRPRLTDLGIRPLFPMPEAPRHGYSFDPGIFPVAKAEPLPKSLREGYRNPLVGAKPSGMPIPGLDSGQLADFGKPRAAPGFWDRARSGLGNVLWKAGEGVDGVVKEAGKVGLGDALVLGGGLYSAFAPMKQTLANRAGDRPNVNYFEDYGKEGLQDLGKSRAHLGQLRDSGLRDLERERSSAQARARQGARGASTARATDIALHSATIRQRQALRDAHTSHLMALLGQEVALKNQRDQAVMQGEAVRDMADRQDRDAFYTQLAQDMMARGRGVQEAGRALNQMRRNREMEELLKQWSKYGITV